MDHKRSQAKTITVPQHFIPRHYQLQLFTAMDGIKDKPESKYKKAFLVIHRRGGKDMACFAYMCKEAATKVGIYYYFFPYYEQGRKALWETIHDGIRMLDFIPRELVKRVDNKSMLIELTNNSIIRVVGADNIDSIVGTNPVGVVWSEFALQNKYARTYITPILAQNGGWEIVNTTPRGRNHAYELFQYASKSPEWFTMYLDVHKTSQYEKLKTQIEEDRMVYGEEYVRQEYYCDWFSQSKGSVLGEWIETATKENRIGHYPCNSSLSVDVAWDLGVGDAAVAWFFQVIGGRIRFIDHWKATGCGIPDFVDMLVLKRNEKGYKFRNIFLPHDGKHRNVQTGKETEQLFREHLRDAGINVNVLSVPRPRAKMEAVMAVRYEFSNYEFDETGCAEGLNNLIEWKFKWDQKKDVFSQNPDHDQYSHDGDALTTVAMAQKTSSYLSNAGIKSENLTMETTYDILSLDDEEGTYSSRPGNGIDWY